MTRALLWTALVACGVSLAAPAAAVDGQITITQADALAGDVTPGDAAGFPVTITQSGSYKLASNLNVTADKIGIDANATEVSIDLNGFRIDGARVASHGIVGRQRSLTVRNGTIRAFKFDGVLTFGALMIVEDVRVFENGRTGIWEHGASAAYARIVNSTIFANGSQGILCRACHVEGNVIASNGLDGLRVLENGTALGNTIMSNGGYGISSPSLVGFGNNTIIHNKLGPALSGGKLFPNVCAPQAC